MPKIHRDRPPTDIDAVVEVLDHNDSAPAEQPEQPEQEKPQRPGTRASVDEWRSYVVAAGYTDETAASTYTKAECILLADDEESDR